MNSKQQKIALIKTFENTYHSFELFSTVRINVFLNMQCEHSLIIEGNEVKLLTLLRLGGLNLCNMYSLGGGMT